MLCVYVVCLCVHVQTCVCVFNPVSMACECVREVCACRVCAAPFCPPSGRSMPAGAMRCSTDATHRRLNKTHDLL